MRALIENSRRVQRYLSVALLTVLALLIVIDRLQGFNEAYERDLTAYAVIGSALLDGQSLYEDVWDHKPPGVHLTYAAFFWLIDDKPMAIWLMGILMSVMTLIGCYRVSYHMGGKYAAWFTAIIWAITNGDLAIQGNQPNVEVFMNACLVWALSLIIKPSFRLPWVNGLAIGLLFFLASAYKPIAVLVPVFVIPVWLVASWAQGARSTFIANIKVATVTLVVGAIGWFLIFGYFYFAGTFGAFFMAVFDYNQGYAGDIFANIGRSFHWQAHPDDKIIGIVPLFLLSLTMVLILVCRFRHINGGLYLAYLGSSCLMVVLPGYFHPHYYQLLLPVVAIGAGLIVANIKAVQVHLVAILLGFSMVWLVALRLPQKWIPVEQIPVFKYGKYEGSIFTESRIVAGWIRSRYVEKVTIFQWGAEPGVYFWSGKSSPIRFVYNYPLRGQFAIDNGLIAESIETLEKIKPDVVIVSVFHLQNGGHPVDHWIHQNYHPVGSYPPTRYLYFFERNR